MALLPGRFLTTTIRMPLIRSRLFTTSTAGAPHFTAHVYVTQDNLKGTAVIKGSVTDGSLKGARVNGEYWVINPCGIINAQNSAFGDVCFQGNLVIRPGSEN